MNSHGSIGERNALNSSPHAQRVEYNHGNRSGCLKGTRKTVLDKIECWSEDFSKPPVYWLSGLAGTGKSTIAQTFAEQLFANGHLGASFFCSRDVEDQSDLQLIIPTLAFQLAHKFPTFRSSFIPLIQSRQGIIYESLQAQMQYLIVNPLRSEEISTVIVVDALDECRGKYPQSAFLHVLGESVSKIPGVKFFITSRPEKDIMSRLNNPELQVLTDSFVLHMVDRHTVESDIRLFFKYELSKLAPKCNGIEHWPTDEELSSLCHRAGGFFVYAVATVKFLDHRFKLPSARLNVIMKSPESTVYEGKVKLETYTSLDSLYLSIFEGAFGDESGEDNDAEDYENIQSVLCAVILAFNPLSPAVISSLLGLEQSLVLSILESIQSLLVLHGGPNEPVQSFHKSFPDFIMDPTRCIDTRFCISPDHQTLALHCIKLLNKSPQENGWKVPNDLSGPLFLGLIKEIQESGIYEALVYAYGSWHQHLITIEHPTADVISALSFFFEQRFLFWTRMLCPVAIQKAVQALCVTAVWLKKVRPGLYLDCLAP